MGQTKAPFSESRQPVIIKARDAGVELNLVFHGFRHPLASVSFAGNARNARRNAVRAPDDQWNRCRGRCAAPQSGAAALKMHNHPQSGKSLITASWLCKPPRQFHRRLIPRDRWRFAALQESVFAGSVCMVRAIGTVPTNPVQGNMRLASARSAKLAAPRELVPRNTRLSTRIFVSITRDLRSPNAKLSTAEAV